MKKKGGKRDNDRYKRAVKEITVKFKLIPLKLYIKIIFKQDLGLKPYPQKSLYHKTMKKEIMVGKTKINLKIALGWKSATTTEKIIGNCNLDSNSSCYISINLDIR